MNDKDIQTINLVGKTANVVSDIKEVTKLITGEKVGWIATHKEPMDSASFDEFMNLINEINHYTDIAGRELYMAQEQRVAKLTKKK